MLDETQYMAFNVVCAVKYLKYKIFEGAWINAITWFTDYMGWKQNHCSCSDTHYILLHYVSKQTTSCERTKVLLNLIFGWCSVQEYALR